MATESLKKHDTLGGYTLIEDFRVAGGRSRISFATKGDKKWFVKEFLSPKYPTPDSPGSPKTKAYKQKMCDEWEAHQRKIMEVTNAACSGGSNLICAKELIRHGASYYKISECVDTSTLSPKDVSALSFKEVIIILRSLAGSLRVLHTNKIVHGDLKPENILIKKTVTGAYTAKLIDFDDSYFDGKPSEDHQAVVGTPEYYSPEVFEYISDEDEEVPGSTLTCKADIYTLGVVFCEYLTGKRPEFDPEKYTYAYAATMSGEDELSIPYNRYVTEELRSLLLSMLRRNAEDRPNISQVFDELKKVDVNATPIPAKKPTKKSPATGKAFEKTDKEESKVKTPEDSKLPIAFPKLKLPKSLVALLHRDSSDGVVTITDPGATKKKSTKETEAHSEAPKLKIKSSTPETEAKSKTESKPSSAPKLKGSLFK